MKSAKTISPSGTVRRQLWRLLLLLVVFGATSASADLIFNFTNQADGVHVDVSGSLDTSSFSFVASGDVGSLTDIQSASANLSIGPSGVVNGAVFTVPDGTLQPFGTSSNSSYGTFVSGSYIALDSNGGQPDQLLLPGGYMSGDPLNASAIFPGTFADYGFPNHDVVTDLPGNQTITFHFASVPDSGSTLLLLVVGLGGVALAQRGRRGLAA